MNSYKLFKAVSIAFILLGLLHLMAHFRMTVGQEPNQLMIDMQNFKIDLFGEHSLLKFHSGFSIMMGFLISAFGLQNLLCADFILHNRKALLSTILISAAASGLAIAYFHILAYGFILFSLGCYIAGWVKKEKFKPEMAI